MAFDTPFASPAVTPSCTGRSPSGPTGPQDVHGRIDIRVGLMPTGLTSEPGLGEPVLSSDVPAARAPLGGVAGVHSNDLATGLFRLVRDAPQELSPPGVGDGAVEAAFGRRPVGFVGAVIAFPGPGAT